MYVYIQSLRERKLSDANGTQRKADDGRRKTEGVGTGNSQDCEQETCVLLYFFSHPASC